MSKTWRHSREEKKPKRIEPKAPRKVRPEEFVNPVEDDDSDDLYYPEDDEYAAIRNYT